MAPATPQRLDPGTVVANRYRIEAPLGEGGFGVVYRAIQLSMGRRVALKVMRSGYMDAEGFARFRREAELAQRLSHPNTVRIYDIGVDPGASPFLVWELLEGHTLGQTIARGPVAPDRVARIATQVLKSLMEAHGLGIVHRDIKPSNVFLCSYCGEPDFVKVLDFGIAKEINSPGARGLTRLGQFVGTLAYMAPEQFTAEGAIPATDLYALGLVMAEALTGYPVVVAQTGVEIIHQHVSSEPVRLRRDVLEGPLGAVIQRATQKDPSLRYRTAQEMLADLEALRPSLLPANAGASAGPPALAVTTPGAPHFLPTGEVPLARSAATGVSKTQPEAPAQLPSRVTHGAAPFELPSRATYGASPVDLPSQVTHGVSPAPLPSRLEASGGWVDPQTVAATPASLLPAGVPPAPGDANVDAQSNITSLSPPQGARASSLPPFAAPGVPKPPPRSGGRRRSPLGVGVAIGMLATLVLFGGGALVMRGVGASPKLSPKPFEGPSADAGSPANLPDVVVSGTHSNQGWTVFFHLREPALDFWYKGPNDRDYVATGHSPHDRNHGTGEPLASTYASIPGLRGKVPFYVRYRDSNGGTKGPFYVVFDTVAETLAEAKQQLEHDIPNWLSFHLSYDGKERCYFSSLLSYKNALTSIHYGVDSEVTSRRLQFTPSEDSSYSDGDQRYIEIPKTTSYVTVEIAYLDGSKSRRNCPVVNTR